ncbi:tripartite motif-containing protein 16-like [Polypterus senegalus]|uniref:tripartite motif-containing protein 16-like n=1 Tax=Polypterus senegalus TaxID=55291 RepID=UPI0019637D24|nr:tripartite motif-containing protein 16-like [Polypterus senegalus]
MMAEAGLLVLQDQFICSVCLDTMRDPASVPCGHNFCMKCITNYWDRTGESGCPQCREIFTPRPVLRKNTLLSEVIEQFKTTGLGLPSSENYPVESECDFCTEKKSRAVKSCLTCLVSFCEKHIQPHYEKALLKNHKLVDPAVNLQQKLCTKHEKPMDLFCRDDQTCICYVCFATEHRSHDATTPETERAEKQNDVDTKLCEVREGILERSLKIQEMKESLGSIKLSADQEALEVENSFASLIHCIEDTRSNVMDRIRELEKMEITKTEEVMEQLEREIEELKSRDAELTRLSETNDHIHFLQTFPFISVLTENEDSLQVTVTKDFSTEDLRKQVSQLTENLLKISQWNFSKITKTTPVYVMVPPEPQKREDFLKYSCSLTLDPRTANRHLHLFSGNRKATWKSRTLLHLHHPERFDCYSQVLCREGFFNTRCYWEVEWSRTVTIAVSYKSIRRKGKEDECRLGYNDKSWGLSCSSTFYRALHSNWECRISAPRCSRIGVYLDCVSGCLSFYSISETMNLLHKFQTNFTEPVYPGFRVHKGDSESKCDSSITIC